HRHSGPCRETSGLASCLARRSPSRARSRKTEPTACERMRYWDASALVSLCVAERTSAVLRRLAPGGIVTWCLSAVEISSAIERRGRDGSLSATGREAALKNLRELAAAWSEVSALAVVRDRACRLLATHALRAADSLQLAAALTATNDRPSGHDFVAADN